MTILVEELLLELELVQVSLRLLPLRGVSETQYIKLQSKLVAIMDTILKSTISGDCLATLEAIDSGDMT